MSAGEKYEKSTETHTATTRAQGRREANTAPHEATNLLQSERRGRKRKKKKKVLSNVYSVFIDSVLSLASNVQSKGQKLALWH